MYDASQDQSHVFELATLSTSVPKGFRGAPKNDLAIRKSYPAFPKFSKQISLLSGTYKTPVVIVLRFYQKFFWMSNANPFK